VFPPTGTISTKIGWQSALSRDQLLKDAIFYEVKQRKEREVLEFLQVLSLLLTTSLKWPSQKTFQISFLALNEEKG